MGRLQSEPEKPPETGWLSGSLYCASVGARTLLAMLAVALLAAPIGRVVVDVDRGAEGAGALIAGGLVLLGIGIPCIAFAQTRADWNAAAGMRGLGVADHPAVRMREPRTLIRPLAYTVIMLTLGGAAAVLALLVVVGSVVALISPILVAVGDQAVIGPFTVRTVPQSVLAAAIGLALLTGLLLISPRAARAHSTLVAQVLTRPEQRLQLDLARTAQSRTRLVRAFDVERRRIERDLHDGVQPQLMSVSMSLGLALAEMPADAPGRDDVLRAQDQAGHTLETLRRFVRNIHPQVLIDHGLGAAVAELADTLTMPITVEDRVPGRLPPAVETNLYFCVAELMTNVVKHSGATRCRVRLSQPRAGLAEISVHDDGTGGAGAHRHPDGGLDGVADRIAAFEGTLTVDSPVGGPTTITITLVIPEEDDVHA